MSNETNPAVPSERYDPGACPECGSHYRCGTADSGSCAGCGADWPLVNGCQPRSAEVHQTPPAESSVPASGEQLPPLTGKCGFCDPAWSAPERIATDTYDYRDGWHQLLHERNDWIAWANAMLEKIDPRLKFLPEGDAKRAKLSALISISVARQIPPTSRPAERNITAVEMAQEFIKEHQLDAAAQCQLAVIMQRYKREVVAPLTVEASLIELQGEPLWIKIEPDGEATVTLVRRVYGQGDMHDVEQKFEGISLNEALAQVRAWKGKQENG